MDWQIALQLTGIKLITYVLFSIIFYVEIKIKMLCEALNYV